MERASIAAEIFLVPIDPSRGLQRIAEDLERLTKLDPKLNAAVELLAGRLNSYTGEARETILAVLWAYGRPRVQQGGLAGIRTWLDDGGSVLAIVKRRSTPCSPSRLTELLQHGTELAARTDSPSGGELRQAREEVRQVLSADLIPIFALAGVGLAAIYLEVTAENPPPASTAPACAPQDEAPGAWLGSRCPASQESLAGRTVRQVANVTAPPHGPRTPGVRGAPSGASASDSVVPVTPGRRLVARAADDEDQPDEPDQDADEPGQGHRLLRNRGPPLKLTGSKRSNPPKSREPTMPRASASRVTWSLWKVSRPPVARCASRPANGAECPVRSQRPGGV